MRRRLFTLLAALVPAVLLFIVATSAVVPLVAMGPGPTYDTFGEAEIQAESGEMQRVPVIEVVGTEADPTSGALRMTTVAVRDRLTLADAVRYWLDPAQVVVPRDQVFPPNQTRDQVKESNAALMVGSENSAEAAAYRFLGMPLVPTVEAVDPNGAVAGLLEPGDVLVSVDGVAVGDAAGVVEQVGAHRAGDAVTIEYTRAGVTATTTATLLPVGGEADPGEGRLGILVGDSPSDGVGVAISVDPGVGGPSAGLVLALAIVDKLSPGDLMGGADIAGTGTIDPDGVVGPIGGIRHKIRAAHDEGSTEFLVPSGNCAEAMQSPPEGIRLIEVSTLAGAVEALETVSAGGQPPTCG